MIDCRLISAGGELVATVKAGSPLPQLIRHDPASTEVDLFAFCSHPAVVPGKIRTFQLIGVEVDRSGKWARYEESKSRYLQMEREG